MKTIPIQLFTARELLYLPLRSLLVLPSPLCKFIFAQLENSKSDPQLLPKSLMAPLYLPLLSPQPDLHVEPLFQWSVDEEDRFLRALESTSALNSLTSTPSPDLHPP